MPELEQVVGEVLGHLLGERGDEDALVALGARADLGRRGRRSGPWSGARSPRGRRARSGRTICSTTCVDTSSSYGLGVADRNTTWLTFSMNSSKRSGRLSIADGRRKPCSTSVSLRERSPSYWPCSCGTVTCDSSTTHEVVVGEVVEQRVRHLARRRARRGGASSSRCPSTRRPRAASRGRRWCACGAAAPRAACRAPRTTPAARASSASMPSIAALHALVVGDVVRRREQHEPVELLDDLAGERVDRRDALDLVAEELDAAPPAPRRRGTPRWCRPGPGTCCGRRRSRCARTASSTRRPRIARWSRSSPTSRMRHCARVLVGRAEAVDRRHRRDDDHVAPAT